MYYRQEYPLVRRLVIDFIAFPIRRDCSLPNRRDRSDRRDDGGGNVHVSANGNGDDDGDDPTTEPRLLG